MSFSELLPESTAFMMEVPLSPTARQFLLQLFGQRGVSVLCYDISCSLRMSVSVLCSKMCTSQLTLVIPGLEWKLLVSSKVLKVVLEAFSTQEEQHH